MPRKQEYAYQTEGDVFASRLREVMEKRGENQTTLAAKITNQSGVIQRQSISQYMQGQSKPDTVRLTGICKALNVSSDYLLGLADHETPDFDQRKACEYTGLSEESMGQIKLMKSYTIAYLSGMLENKKFRSIVASHDDLRKSYNRCVPYMNLILLIKDGVPFDDPEMITAIDEASLDFPGDDGPREEDYYDYVLDVFAEYYSELRMMVFELNDMWSDYLESFLPAKELLTEGKEFYQEYAENN